MSYATPADFTAWNSTLVQPTDIQRLLDRASDLLDAALITALYNVDSSSNPTDTTTIAALKNACCAQVEWWLITDKEFGLPLGVQSANLASGGVEQKASPGPIVSASWAMPRSFGRNRLAPRAWEILSVARLWNVRPLAL